ncbi:MAG: hypothetical protein WBP08_03230, partial [Saprospiraceae bacterium]
KHAVIGAIAVSSLESIAMLSSQANRSSMFHYAHEPFRMARTGSFTKWIVMLGSSTSVFQKLRDFLLYPITTFGDIAQK